MAAKDKINVYFPIVNLNPQGWISQFITPILSKTVPNRSGLANLFYDTIINVENLQHLEKIGFSDKDIGNFITRRSSIEEDKMIFLNGNFLDRFEVEEPLRESTLEEKELAIYTKFMSTIKPHQQAFLQPYIKLQYGYRNNKKEEFTWVDFPFTQKYDIDFILGPGKPRSEGSGITNVSTENQLNIATHINSQIRINFLFGNMQILTQEMNEDGIPTEKNTNKKFPYGFSFLKLASNFDFNKEIIRLEYGRKVAPGFEEEIAGGEGQLLRSVIEKREKKVFLLSKTKHDFSFDEKGVIELSVYYNNFHDERMGLANNVAIPSPTPANSQALDLPITYGNFLVKYKELMQQTKVLEEKIQQTMKTDESQVLSKSKQEERNVTISKLNEDLAAANKNLNLIKRSLKPSLSTIFIDKIKSQGQLFAVSFKTTKDKKVFKVETFISLIHPESGDFSKIYSYEDSYDMDQFLTRTPVPKGYESNNKKLEEDLTKTYARIFNSPYDYKEKENTDKNYGHIMFFPLKALFSVAYSFLDEEEKKEIPYMLFGNVLLKVGAKMVSVNIGDLLIETETFQKWYYEKFFRKDRLDYPFGVFIRDIMLDLVPEALHRNRTGFDDRSPTSAVKEVQYYLLDEPSEKLKQYVYIRNNLDDLKELSKMLSRIPTSNPKPIIYFGQINNQTTQVPSPLFSNLGVSEFKFNEEEDAKKGIPHIKIGADGGFFTKVGFSAQDFSKIRTAMALESLADKASRYFFFYYQLSIESMGTNMFNYDSVVCVPSNPLGGDSQENDTGVAGYYKVINISDNIDANNYYTSTSRADWVFNPKYADREKDKMVKAPSSDMIIKDRVDCSINDPKNYIEEVLENDVNTIINAQAQNMPQQDKKEEAKKDNEKKPEKIEMKVDKEEKFGTKTPTPK